MPSSGSGVDVRIWVSRSFVFDSHHFSAGGPPGSAHGQSAFSTLAVGDTVATATSQKALTSLSADGDAAATADSKTALTSLSRVASGAIANAQEALTSPSGVETGASANAQKALTSLAVAEQDILGRSASSAPSDSGLLSD